MSRSIASPISLPNAKEAPFATLARSSIWLWSNPADTPTAVALIACSAEIALSVISLSLSATSVRFWPAALPVNTKPSFSFDIASFRDSKPKAAVNANTFAAKVAYAGTRPPVIPVVIFEKPLVLLEVRPATPFCCLLCPLVALLALSVDLAAFSAPLAILLRLPSSLTLYVTVIVSATSVFSLASPSLVS